MEQKISQNFMQYVYGPISIQFRAKLEENQSIGMQNLCDGAGGHASFLAIEKATLRKEISLYKDIAVKKRNVGKNKKYAR